MIEQLPAGCGRILQGEEEVLRVLGSRKKWIAATVGVAVIGTFVTVALASHTPFNFTQEVKVTSTLAKKVKLNSDRIKFQTKGPTDVRVARVVIGPGGHSGWHHHPGIVIAAVLSGVVTFTHSDCSSKTYGPGSVFVESGDDPGRASSTAGAELYATFVAPHANPPVFRVDDHAFAGCP
jgi:quercetin dioxygenase-like cupin family protein